MFSWDAGKATGNRKKHLVTFEEAATVFSDPEGPDWDDFEHSDSEGRSLRLGFPAAGRVLFVVYTIRRLKPGKETIRIISDSAGDTKRAQRISRVAS